MSGIIAPTVVVFLLAKPLATAFGRQPNLSIVSSTFFLVEGLTFGLPFTTLETVAIDTFASRATSYIVTVISLPPDASIVLFVHHFTISQGLRLIMRIQWPIILD